jgi:hypothetical protein
VRAVRPFYLWARLMPHVVNVRSRFFTLGSALEGRGGVQAVGQRLRNLCEATASPSYDSLVMLYILLHLNTDARRARGGGRREEAGQSQTSKRYRADRRAYSIYFNLQPLSLPDLFFLP